MCKLVHATSVSGIIYDLLDLNGSILVYNLAHSGASVKYS